MISSILHRTSHIMLNFIIIAWDSTYNWPLNSHLPNVTLTSFALANNFLDFSSSYFAFVSSIFSLLLVPNVSDQC